MGKREGVTSWVGGRLGKRGGYVVGWGEEVLARGGGGGWGGGGGGLLT